MSSFYKIGAGNVQLRNVVPEAVSRAYDSLAVGASDLAYGNRRFYKIGVNPKFVENRTITGVPALDHTINYAQDIVGVGRLLLGSLTIGTLVP